MPSAKAWVQTRVASGISRSISSAGRLKLMMRRVWSTCLAKGPPISESRPCEARWNSMSCTPRRWAWTMPSAKARSRSLSASMKGTWCWFQRMVSLPSSGRFSVGNCARRCSRLRFLGRKPGINRQRARGTPGRPLRVAKSINKAMTFLLLAYCAARPGRRKASVAGRSSR